MPDTRDEPTRRLYEHLVADLMAVLVVDRLEPVEVDEGDGERVPGALAEQDVDGRCETGAGGCAGERVDVDGAGRGLSSRGGRESVTSEPISSKVPGSTR